MSQSNPYPIFDLTNDQELFNNDYNLTDVSSVNPYSQNQAGPSNSSGFAVGPIRSSSIPLAGSSSAPYTRRQPRSIVSRTHDLTSAQEFISDSPNSSDANLYSQSQAGSSSGSGSALGPIRSTSVLFTRSSSTPYTRQQPRSTVSRGGHVQPLVSGVFPYYPTSPAEEWNYETSNESKLVGSIGQVGAAIAGGVGPSLSQAPPTLIMQWGAVEPWMENSMGSAAQVPLRNSPAGTPAGQPSTSTTTAPLPVPADSYPSAFRVAAQPATQPMAPSLGEWQLESPSHQHTTSAVHQNRPTTPEPSPVQEAYNRLAADSQHYRRCTTQKCTMQHWNGKVRHQVWRVVALTEGPKGPIMKLQDSTNWDLLARYPKVTALVNQALQWWPSQEVHLHSLASATLINTNGRDLRTAIPGFNRIPGSLQLLVLMGGEQFYDELRKQVKVRWKILSVAIGNALQLCNLVICDEFWKQLETEKEAIEAWREHFFIDLFDMKNPDRRFKI